MPLCLGQAAADSLASPGRVYAAGYAAECRHGLGSVMHRPGLKAATTLPTRPHQPVSQPGARHSNVRNGYRRLSRSGRWPQAPGTGPVSLPAASLQPAVCGCECGVSMRATASAARSRDIEPGPGRPIIFADQQLFAGDENRRRNETDTRGPTCGFWRPGRVDQAS